MLFWKNIYYFYFKLIYCVLSTGGRRHRVFEVWKRAVAGAGWRHLPPHEDVVSSWLALYVSSFICKSPRRRSAAGEVTITATYHNPSFRLSYSLWINMQSARNESHRLPFACCAPPIHQLLPCRVSTLLLSADFFSVFSPCFTAWKTNRGWQPWPTYQSFCQR